jgi:hypothetical protein
MKYLFPLLVLSLVSLACKREIPKKQQPATPVEQVPDTETVMTPAPPPEEPPRPVNPRIKEPGFSANTQEVEVVRLPAGDGQVQYVLAGRFDRGLTSLLAYVYPDRIQFRTPDGAVVAATAHPGFPRLVRLVDGQGRRPDRVLVGWGRNVAARPPDERLSFTLTDASALTAEKKPQAVHEVILQTTSSRADPVDAVIASDGSLYLAWFSDKYTVRVGLRAAGVPEVKELVSASMIGRLAVATRGAGENALFVARVYGDEPGSNGGLFRLEDGKLAPLPSVRGVRGLWATATKDGFEVWTGDGWDKDYGKVAQALVSVVTIRDQAAERRQVAEIAAGYSVMSIAPCALHGPDKPGFVLKTNNQLLWIDAAAAAPPIVLASWGGPSEPVVADVDGDGRHELFIGSPEPVYLRARKK